MQKEALSPRLIVVTGRAGSGKSTTMQPVCLAIDNAVIFDKDVFNKAYLQVPVGMRDSVSNGGNQRFRPLLEQMNKIGLDSKYYRLHVQPQTYLAMEALAWANMVLGKVAILDSLPPHQFRSGEIQNLADRVRGNYPVYLIHFMAEEQDCYERLVARGEERDLHRISSSEAFNAFLEREPMLPPELLKIPHLEINTSEMTPSRCIAACLNHVRDPLKAI